MRGRLRGATIVFPFVSVGATENLLMAACLADGQTVLANAAREPEIGDLAALPDRDGRADRGHRQRPAGRSRASTRLHGAEHAIIPDRIETGTYACAAAITGGDGAPARRPARASRRARAHARARPASRSPRSRAALHVRRLNGLHGADVMTEPYPGFPTDMQAQFMALMAVAEGAAMVTETIFENRFMHVPELNRMGARINVHGASAIVRGVPALSGAPVMATDLRASVSLVLAGLAARGETVVNRVYHLDRGYERVEQKLAGLRGGDRAARGIATRNAAEVAVPRPIGPPARWCRGPGPQVEEPT